MTIQITTAKGKRLLLEKKIATEDVEVVPVLEDVTLTANGTYKASEGFAGIGSVTAKVLTDGTWKGIFSESASYLVSDVVYYRGGIYKCLDADGSVPTTSASWEYLGDVETGSLNVYSNGSHDVTGYKTIHVAVPDENNWEGNYEDGVAYKYGALVVYKNAVYLALADTDGTISPDNEEYWVMLNVILDTWDGTGVIISPTTNFTLSDGEALLTSDGQIFNITEE